MAAVRFTAGGQYGTCGGIVPVIIWSPEEEGSWQPGGASKWWLHQSLATLDQSLRALFKETGAMAVFWNCGRRAGSTIARG